MAFDAGFVAAIVAELKRDLVGAKIEKVMQPDKDAVVLHIHPDRERGASPISPKLLIDAGSGAPRIGFTTQVLENPKAPPMFCMLLRKHLVGARVTAVRQLGFERAVEISLDARDEMGFTGTKYLICETMGRCSNLIFLSGDYRIIASLKTVDFSTSRVRQILPGVTYELPPLQPGKVSPLGASKEDFIAAWNADKMDGKGKVDKFIMAHYLGISPLIAREIAHRALGGDCEAVWSAFSEIYGKVEREEFTPILVRDEKGEPLEYSFVRLFQYGGVGESEAMADFSTLTDAYFGAKTKAAHLKQRSADILRILTNAETRLNKKLALQREDLAQSVTRENDKLCGDLITANIYRLKKGMKEAELENYYSPDYEPIKVILDSRLTPAQNAQKYYKRYNKAKSAELHLTEQIAIGEKELAYVESVFEALTKAEGENDLEEIRRELYESGYASKMKGYMLRKPTQVRPLTFVTPGGYQLLCGKNNSQNDHITHKVAEKGDLWFHVHGMPGSHVVLLCDGEEPGAEDYTFAATVAATYSKAGKGDKVQVDYTRIKNVKKPPASKPGYVTYSTNHSAFVESNEALVKEYRK